MSKEISVDEYESPSGHHGYRVPAPRIPGCVVIHGNGAHAVMLVREAVIAIAGEPAQDSDVSDEIAMLSHRCV